jgi:hypothetical protein
MLHTRTTNELPQRSAPNTDLHSQVRGSVPHNFVHPHSSFVFFLSNSNRILYSTHAYDNILVLYLHGWMVLWISRGLLNDTVPNAGIVYGRKVLRVDTKHSELDMMDGEVVVV